MFAVSTLTLQRNKTACDCISRIILISFNAMFKNPTFPYCPGVSWKSTGT